MTKKTNDGLEALILFSQLGLTIALPIIIGATGGNFVSNKFSFGNLPVVLGLIIGITIGLFGAYKLLVSVVFKDKK